MTTRKASWWFVLLSALLLAATGTAFAETRLFVPQFRYDANEDTQLLVANQNDQDSVLDFWAFSSDGEFLGQFQMQLRAHSTRSLMLGNALRLDGRAVGGWIGAVSADNGIQLSYSSIRDSAETDSIRTFDAQEWITRETLLSVENSEKSVVRISNPNPFPAQVTVRGSDASGSFVGARDLMVEPFSQVETTVQSLVGRSASRINVLSNADVLTAVDEARALRRALTGSVSRVAANAQEIAVIIDSDEPLGAYQLTLRFDPEAVQFATRDIEGGSVDGFDSRPLVVNIDNYAGELTLASFQVGARPSGRLVVARLNVVPQSTAAPRFGIHVAEITDIAGVSLPAGKVAVGLVRMR